MRKTLSLLLVGSVLLALLCGCGGKQEAPAPAAASETPAAESVTAAEEITAPAEATPHYPVTIENVNYELEKVSFTYEKAPERVLTFWTNSLETMLSLGLGDRVAMAVGYFENEEDLLPELRGEYESIRETLELNNSFLDSNAALTKEAAVMLQPDFILGWKSSFSDKTIGDTTYWNEKNIGTYIALNSNNVSEYRTLENEYKDILNIGRIFDVEERAEAIVAELRAEVERVATETAGLPKKSCLVLSLMGDKIRNYDSTMLAGNMVEVMGGELLPASGDLGKEDLLNLNPEVIFVIGGNENRFDPSVVEIITEDPGLASLRAVESGSVFHLPLSYVYTSGVRTIYGLKAIGEGLYPELYR